MDIVYIYIYTDLFQIYNSLIYIYIYIYLLIYILTIIQKYNKLDISCMTTVVLILIVI